MPERQLRFHLRPHVRSLSALVAEARTYAEAALRSSGAVQPTLLALTPQGLATHYPEKMQTQSDKEQFVLECRLVLVATRASMCALILESFITALSGAEPILGPAIVPGRREEVVTVYAQSQKEERSFLFPILRTALGVYERLGDDTAPDGLLAMGLFTNLLPAAAVKSRHARQAGAALERMGVHVLSKGGFSTN